MRRPLSLCLIPAFVLVAAACGANPAPSDDVGAQGGRTARVETVIRFTGDSTAETHELRSIGVLDYENDSSEYHVEPSGCRTITIGDVSYAETPMEEGNPAGKRWMRFGGELVDTEDAFEKSQKSPIVGYVAAVASFSVSFAPPEPAPDEYLDYLRENSGEPERVGTEDIRGVSTTRYHAELDIRDLARKQLETESWKAENIELSLQDVDGVRDIEVWVDSNGIVRRIVTMDTAAGAGQTMIGGWVTTTEFFDFGLAVEIQPPPAAEVMESVDWQQLPGALEPEMSPGSDSNEPPSCRH